MHMRKNGVILMTVLAASVYSALAVGADSYTYYDSAGQITATPTSNYIKFNDWSYTGPTGVGAYDFQVGSGFNASQVGQVQKVITKSPDWLTPSTTGPTTVYGDNWYPYPQYNNTNLDGTVNFYKWAYTTPANSTFSNMQIDKAGNYLVAKNDMSFGFYNTFTYKTGTNPAQDIDTGINFQPYAVSDAKGWCGSVMVQNPYGLANMAGQVTFDFAFDAYLGNSSPSLGGLPNTQIVPGFIMRSYGDYEVNFTTSGGDLQNFTGSAVGNNTNPTSVVAGVGGALDENFANQVSFLGGGVVPLGVWVSSDSFVSPGVKKTRQDCNPTTGVCNTVWDVKTVAAGTAGAVWHNNSFGGYAFLLRADANRTLEWISPTGHSAYVATVPVPAAAWLFGSGLLGLAGIARRKKKA